MSNNITNFSNLSKCEQNVCFPPFSLFQNFSKCVTIHINRLWKCVVLNALCSAAEWNGMYWNSNFREAGRSKYKLTHSAVLFSIISRYNRIVRNMDTSQNKIETSESPFILMKDIAFPLLFLPPYSLKVILSGLIYFVVPTHRDYQL